MNAIHFMHGLNLWSTLTKNLATGEQRNIKGNFLAFRYLKRRLPISISWVQVGTSATLVIFFFL